MPEPIIFRIRRISFRSNSLFNKRCQIIIAVAAFPAHVENVFGTVRVLVWPEAGIGTAAHLLDTCQVPVEVVIEEDDGVNGGRPPPT